MRFNPAGHNRGKACLLTLALLMAVTLCPFSAIAEGTKPLAEKDVPAPLKPWVSWVLHDAQGVHCPRFDGEAGNEAQSVCGWPGQLSLSLDVKAGKFSQSFEIYETTMAPLPGNAEDDSGEPARWPLDVSVDGKRAAVVAKDGHPHLELSPGKHTVTGRFAWDALPESLRVPSEVALVSLTVQGKSLPFAQRTPDGRIFLARATAEDETDSVEITVHRKVTDGVPLLLTTRLSLAVSGKSRELSLGRALPEGFVPLSIESVLPVRVLPDGHLTVQVRPGQWVVQLVARNVQHVQSITRPDPQGLWKEGEEAWVFEAAPDVRAVTVEGVAAIDPQQTTLPNEWKSLPTYALEQGATLKLVEHQRGNEPPLPDRLSLSRELWLDFDGAGFTARDQISGTLSKSWRLAMPAPAKLGRLSVNGEDQFITKLVEPKSSEDVWGAELRYQNANIQADSRLPRSGVKLGAVSWRQDFDALSGQVHLGPGWKLLLGSGADHITGSWIQSWSLLDLFLLLIVAVSVQRLYGWRLGAVAFAALVLSLNETQAPAWIWLSIVLGEALVRLVPPGKLSWLPRGFRLGAWGIWLVIFLPFAAQDIRSALHPAASQGQSGWSMPMLGAAAAPEPDRFLQMVQKKGAEEASDAAEAPSEIEGDGAVIGGLMGRPDRSRLTKQKSISYGRAAKSAAMAQNVFAWDKSVVVQTGPGIPTWQWQTIGFSFNGPVQADQQISLWLMPPWLTGGLALLRVALLALLAFVMFRRGRHGSGWFPSTSSVAASTAIVLIACLAFSAPVFAQEPAPASPAPAVLDTLKERLLRPATCSPDCASVDELSVEASPQELKLRFTISSLARVAVPIPGQIDGWMPAKVVLNNQNTNALSRDAQGVLWLVVNEGSSTVVLGGAIPPKESFSVSLPIVPKHTTASARGMRIDGLHDDGQASETLQFSRVEASAGATDGKATATSDGLLPLLVVRRTLDLGLRWTSSTTVQRQGSVNTALVTDIPLLNGESVTTAGVRLSSDNRSVSLNLAPDDADFSWASTLAQQETLVLKAPESDRAFVEEWQVQVAPTWHVDVQGIPTLREKDVPDQNARLFVWRPWPGESVTLKITRPTGADGQTLTIDNSSLTFTPGPRSTSATLVLQGRTSRGREHVITLPAGAQVKSISINGVSTPVRSESSATGTRVTLPLSPGANQIAIDWRHAEGNSLAFRPPSVALGVPSTNANTEVNLGSADRWVLWTSGPVMGPAVFFWSYLVILILVGFVLARTKLSPLSVIDWALLGLGLVQVDLWAAAVVGAFFLSLGWRSRVQRPRRAWAYNFTQLTLVAWTIVSAVLVFAAVRAGLLESPDMRVMGNGSNENMLRWYSDQVTGTLPQPLVISVPIFVYRIAMMAWALWLALALLRWSRWVWGGFSAQGLWKAMRAKAPVPPVPPVTPQEP
jgi:hypothetical protein